MLRLLELMKEVLVTKLALSTPCQIELCTELFDVLGLATVRLLEVMELLDMVTAGKIRIRPSRLVEKIE